MRRALWITVVLGSVGAALVSGAASAADYRHHGEPRWEGRAYDRHEWQRRDWDRHYSDAAGRRRYWDGRGWVFMLPAPPHPYWHWDVTLGRYRP